MTLTAEQIERVERVYLKCEQLRPKYGSMRYVYFKDGKPQIYSTHQNDWCGSLPDDVAAALIRDSLVTWLGLRGYSIGWWDVRGGEWQVIHPDTDEGPDGVYASPSFLDCLLSAAEATLNINYKD